jgi:hypothetical protein
MEPLYQPERSCLVTADHTYAVGLWRALELGYANGP